MKLPQGARAAAVACIAALVCSCTSTVRTSPDSLKMEPAAVSHLPPRSVTLVNGHAVETSLRFSVPPNTYMVEPKQMTDTAIEMLRRVLPEGGKGAKRVVLKVHSPRQGGFANPGLAITLDADFGDGTRAQVSGQGYSGLGATRSFEAAILQALNRLVGDQRFVAYMKR